MGRKRWSVHARNSVLFGVSVLLMLACQLCAQTDTGTIVGTVKDPSGGDVPGAKVTITDQATNAVRTKTTDQQGAYTVPLLPPGQYGLNVMKSGFEQYSRSGITRYK